MSPRLAIILVFIASTMSSSGHAYGLRDFRSFCASALGALTRYTTRWRERPGRNDRRFGHEVRTAPETADELFDAFRNGLIPDFRDPEQALAWEVYRKACFGNPNFSLLPNTDATVDRFIKAHPNIDKKPFPTVSMGQVAWTYQRPKRLDEFLMGHRRAVHELKRTILDIRKNEGYWMKRLGIDKLHNDVGNSAERLKKRREELQKIFSDEFCQMVQDTKIPATERFGRLFKKVQELRTERQRTGNDKADPLAQVLVDIAHVQAFEDPTVISGLNDSHPLVVLAAYRKAIHFRYMFAENMGFEHGWEGMLSTLKVKKPSGVLADQALHGQLNAIFQEVERTKVRIDGQSSRKTARLLSLAESPSRSCLGEDCSSRTYLEKALDPNFHYFTLTDPDTGVSSGHVTLVLGTVGQTKTAFIDKVQNVRSEDLADFLEAIRRSVQQLGYALALPADFSQIPSGLSNDPGTVAQLGRLPAYKNQAQVIGPFVPHPHKYNLPNGYSGSDLRLSVKILLPIESETAFELQASTSRPWRVASLNLESIVRKTHELKNGTPEERLRYLAIEPALKNHQRYQDPTFEATIAQWVSDPSQPIHLKRAVLTYFLKERKTNAVVELGASLDQNEKNVLLDSWLMSDSTHERAAAELERLKDWAVGSPHLVKIVVQDCTHPMRFIEWARDYPEALTELAHRLSPDERIAVVLEHGVQPVDPAYRYIVDNLVLEDDLEGSGHAFSALVAWAHARSRVSEPLFNLIPGWLADPQTVAEHKLSIVQWIESNSKNPKAREVAADWIRNNLVSEIIGNPDLDVPTRAQALSSLLNTVKITVAELFAGVPARDAREVFVRDCLSAWSRKHYSNIDWVHDAQRMIRVASDPESGTAPFRVDIAQSYLQQIERQVTSNARDWDQPWVLLSALYSNADAIKGSAKTPQERSALEQQFERVTSFLEEEHTRAILSNLSGYDSKEAADLLIKALANSNFESAQELARAYLPRFSNSPHYSRLREEFLRPRYRPTQVVGVVGTPMLPSHFSDTLSFEHSATMRVGLFKKIQITYDGSSLQYDGRSWGADGNILGVTLLASRYLLVQSRDAFGDLNYRLLRHGKDGYFTSVRLGEPDPLLHSAQVPYNFAFDKTTRTLSIENPSSGEVCACRLSDDHVSRLRTLESFSINRSDGLRDDYRRMGNRTIRQTNIPVANQGNARVIKAYELVRGPGDSVVAVTDTGLQWIQGNRIRATAKLGHTSLSPDDFRRLANVRYQEPYKDDIIDGPEVSIYSEPQRQRMTYPEYFKKDLVLLPDQTVFVASQKGNLYEWFKDGQRLGQLTLDSNIARDPPFQYFPSPNGNIVVALNMNHVLVFDLAKGTGRAIKWSGHYWEPITGARLESDGTIRITKHAVTEEQVRDGNVSGHRKVSQEMILVPADIMP